MKICQVRKDYIPPAKDSQGAERVVESLSRGLINLGHEVTIVADDIPKEDFDIPVRTTIPLNCDIVHYHGWYAENEYDQVPIPWVATPHCGGMETDPEWLKSAENNKDHIICVSNFVSTRLKCPAYVWTCSDPGHFVFSKDKEDYFLWMAGTDWGEGKGLFTTIQLAKKFRFKLKIAGSGQDLNNIAFIKKSCDDKIEYLGSINGKEKAEILSKAKALILLTNLPDACPTTVGEAMLSGTPVIGSINGAMPELISEKVGFICKTEQEVVKAIVSIKKINPLDCLEHGYKNFTNTVSAVSHLHYYNNMLNFGKVKL